MSNVSNCGTGCCPDTVVVNTPGAEGQDAYTTTTANFTIPAIDATVVITVGSTAWMAVGQKVFASDGTDWGTFEVQSIGSSTQFTGVFQGYTDDAAPGAVVGSGAAVVPSGVQSPLTTTSLKALNATLLAGIGAFTDNTGGTASDTLAAGVGIHYWNFYAKLSEVTAAATVGAFTPGYAFKVLSITYLGLQAGTGGAATITFTPTITGVAITGGVLVPTLANAGAGSVVAASTITGANTGTSAATFALTASAITAFTNGTGNIIVKVQNMDDANAFASLADKINDIRAALQT